MSTALELRTLYVKNPRRHGGDCVKKYHVLEYFNRLSDLFFVLSRWIAKQTGEPEYLWQRGLIEKGKGKK